MEFCVCVCVCVCCFSYCCDKISDKKQIKGGRASFGSQFEGIVRNIAAFIVSRDNTQLAFSVFLCQPRSQWFFPTSVKPVWKHCLGDAVYVFPWWFLISSNWQDKHHSHTHPFFKGYGWPVLWPLWPSWHTVLQIRPTQWAQGQVQYLVLNSI